MKNQKILLLICLLYAVALALPTMVQAQFTYTNSDGGIYDYSTNADGLSLTITGYQGPPWAVTIPASMNGLTVTTLGTNAFNGETNLSSITIPDGVVSIEDSAFQYCTNLGGVTIPDNVTSIGNDAFAYCYGLGSLTLSDTLTNLGDGAFLYCSSLAAVTLPESLTYMGSQAFGYCNLGGTVVVPGTIPNIGAGTFSYCEGLRNVIIGDGIGSIGDFAFVSCANLTNVSIPASVTNIGSDTFGECGVLPRITLPEALTSIGPNAFNYCYDLASISIGDNVTNIGSEAFFVCTGLTNVTIAGSAASIGSQAFFACSSLRGLVISNGVSSIGQQAFYGALPLANLSIPASVTNIAPEAFADCTALPAFTVDPSNMFYSSVNGMLLDITQTILVQCPGGLGGACTIPDTVTTIGPYAFYGCQTLVSVTIPASVTNIGDEAFGYSAALADLYFEGNAPAAGASLFYLDNDPTVYYLAGASGWSSTYAGDPAVQLPYGFTTAGGGVTITGYAGPGGEVIIPASLYGLPVIGIGSNAFAGNESLSTVAIPGTVTNIAADAFYGCTNLTSVFFLRNAPTTDPSAFGSDSNATIYYASGTSGWSSSLAGLPTVMWNATATSQFTYTTNGGTITIASYKGTNGAVTIPFAINGLLVSTIKSNAFENKAISGVVFPGSITNIEYSAFAGCDSLGNVTIPNSVTGIASNAFGECVNLTNVTVPGGLIDLAGVFYECARLTNATIAYGVTSIPGGSLFEGGEGGEFAGWSSLTSIQIPQSVTNIGAVAFAGCSGLKTVTIPDSVTTIGELAFELCSSLANVTIPGSVTNIAPQAFDECLSLTSIVFTSNAPPASDLAFYDDASAIVYYLPGTTGWGSTYDELPAMLLPYTLTTNAGAISITGYSGPGGILSIPATIFGLTVASIATNAFYDSSNLTGIILPNAVTGIDSNAFASCSNLVTVAIPASVTNIAGDAFSDCPNLAGVYFASNAPTVASSAFASDTNATIYYGSGATGWSPHVAGLPAVQCTAPSQFRYGTNGAFITITAYIGTGGPVVFPAFINGYMVDGFEESAFLGKTTLTSATILGCVTNIAIQSFYNCSGLTNLTLVNGLGGIGQSAFQGCTSLSNLSLGNGLPSIGANAFEGCTGLGRVTIPAGLTNFGTQAFYNCAKLTNLTFASGLGSIGTNAFQSCTSLRGIVLPPSVTNIATFAFLDCTALTNVNIPATVTSLGSVPFATCTALTAINVDPQNAFYSSSNGLLLDKLQTTILEFPAGLRVSYVISGNITTIGTNAFYGSVLTNVIIPNSVTNIEDNGFIECPNLTSLVIPASVVSLGHTAVANCANLKSLYFAGNAPEIFDDLISNDSGLTVYYLPGTLGYEGVPGAAGWNNFATFVGAVADILWSPSIQTGDGSFGVRNNQFGFNITSGGSNVLEVVVEACTNLANPVWTPLQTITLTNGAAYFSDPQWTNYPARFYGLGAP